MTQRKETRASDGSLTRESTMKTRCLIASCAILLAGGSLAIADPPLAPEDLDASVARLARIGVCYSASFSPDGTRIAFNSDMGGSPQVWTVGAEGGWPEPVTAQDDPVHFLHWSPDGQAIAFTVAPGGGMNEQVYSVRPDGTGLSRLTDGGKETNRLGRWTHDGRALMLASNRRDAAAMDAYLIDAATGRLSLVAQTRGVGGLTDVSRDGRRAVLNRQVSRGDEDLFLLDLPGGREVRLTPHEGPGSFPNGRFAPDGRTVYLSSNAGSDRAAFARVVLGDDGRPGPIEVLAARDDAELSEFVSWGFSCRKGPSSNRPCLPERARAAAEGRHEETKKCPRPLSTTPQQAGTGDVSPEILGTWR